MQEAHRAAQWTHLLGTAAQTLADGFGVAIPASQTLRRHQGCCGISALPSLAVILNPPQCQRGARNLGAKISHVLPVLPTWDWLLLVGMCKGSLMHGYLAVAQSWEWSALNSEDMDQLLPLPALVQAAF